MNPFYVNEKLPLLLLLFLATASSRGITEADETFNAPRRHQPLAEIITEKTLAVQPGRYMAWPTITRARNGNLLVSFSGDRDWHVDPFGKIYLVRSTDNGATWQAPEMVVDTPLDDRDTGLMALPDGTIALVFNANMAYRTLPQYADEAAQVTQEEEDRWTGTFLRLSSDHGLTWGDYLKVPWPTPHGPSPLADGSMIVVRPSVQKSTNRGQTWTEIARISRPSDWNSQYAFLSEQHAVEAADGRIIALSRYREGADIRLRQTQSFDGGLTWTAPTPTELEGYPAHLLRLRNGHLLATYANRFNQQQELAAFSLDNGNTWTSEHPVVLSNAVSQDGGDMGYPSSAQLSDGTIWSVYYQVPPGSTDGLPILMGTHWRPLKPARFRDSIENATPGGPPEPVIGSFVANHLTNNVIRSSQGTNSLGQTHPAASSTGGDQYLIIDRPNGDLGRRIIGELDRQVTTGHARFEVELRQEQGWLSFGTGSSAGGLAVVAEMPLAISVTLLEDGSISVYDGDTGWQTVPGLTHTPGEWKKYAIHYELGSGDYLLVAGDEFATLDAFGAPGMTSFDRTEGFGVLGGTGNAVGYADNLLFFDNVVASSTDIDGDLLPDSFERLIIDADPNDEVTSLAHIDDITDFDGEGRTDLEEFRDGTQPHLPDTDGDGFDDYEESAVYHTDPLVKEDFPPLTLAINMAVELTFQTYRGRLYRVEYSSDLVNWDPLPEPELSAIEGDGTTQSIFVSTKGRRNSGEFYRVVDITN